MKSTTKEIVMTYLLLKVDWKVILVCDSAIVFLTIRSLIVGLKVNWMVVLIYDRAIKRLISRTLFSSINWDRERDHLQHKLGQNVSL